MITFFENRSSNIGQKEGTGVLAVNHKTGQ